MHSVTQLISNLKAGKPCSYIADGVTFLCMPILDKTIERHKVLLVLYEGVVRAATFKKINKDYPVTYSDNHEITIYLLATKSNLKIDCAHILGTVDGYEAILVNGEKKIAQVNKGVDWITPDKVDNPSLKPQLPEKVKVKPKPNRFSEFTDDPFWINIFERKLKEDQ